MRLPLFLVASLALLGGATAASGQQTYVPSEQQNAMFDAVQDSPTPDVTGVINLYQSILTYRYPKNFVPAYQVKQPGSFMIEFIPFGEDVRTNWSKMLTLQAFAKGLGPGISTGTFLSMMRRNVEERCPKASLFEDLGPIVVEGAEAHRVLFGCRTSSVVGGQGFGETTIMQAIKRKDNLIIVQFVVRGKTTSEGQPLLAPADQKIYTSLMDQLALRDNPAAKN